MCMRAWVCRREGEKESRRPRLTEAGRCLTQAKVDGAGESEQELSIQWLCAFGLTTFAHQSSSLRASLLQPQDWRGNHGSYAR